MNNLSNVTISELENVIKTYQQLLPRWRLPWQNTSDAADQQVIHAINTIKASFVEDHVNAGRFYMHEAFTLMQAVFKHPLALSDAAPIWLQQLVEVFGAQAERYLFVELMKLDLLKLDNYSQFMNHSNRINIAVMFQSIHQQYKVDAEALFQVLINENSLEKLYQWLNKLMNARLADDKNVGMLFHYFSLLTSPPIIKCIMEVPAYEFCKERLAHIFYICECVGKNDASYACVEINHYLKHVCYLNQYTYQTSHLRYLQAMETKGFCDLSQLEEEEIFVSTLRPG